MHGHLQLRATIPVMSHHRASCQPAIRPQQDRQRRGSHPKTSLRRRPGARHGRRRAAPRLDAGPHASPPPGGAPAAARRAPNELVAGPPAHMNGGGMLAAVAPPPAPSTKGSGGLRPDPTILVAGFSFPFSAAAADRNSRGRERGEGRRCVRASGSLAVIFANFRDNFVHFVLGAMREPRGTSFFRVRLDSDKKQYTCRKTL